LTVGATLDTKNIMQLKYTVLLATGLVAGSALAYTASIQSDRRTMLKQSVASAMAFVPGVAVVSAAAAAADDAATDADGFITTESGMRYKVLKEGTGAIPQSGQTVKTHYTGTKSLLLRLTG
jgi:peptidylprolyl isomerase